MSSKIQFYTNPMSRGQIARWALEEAGTPYEEHLLDYGTTMKSDEYLELNPMGKVPTIVHDGHVITEAAAICAYLADAFPDQQLTPKPAEKADYFRWLFFAAGPLEQAITAKHLGWAPKGPEQEGTAGFGSYDRVIDTLDKVLSERDFICGDRFTGADIYVGSQIDWGLVFESVPQRASFTAYAERLRARPAYQKAKARDGALIAEMKNDG